MNKEWIAGTEGQNLKFKRETLLNYGRQKLIQSMDSLNQLSIVR